MYTVESLQQYFPAENGWNIVYLEEGQFDRRPTVPGSVLRCIDRRFGITDSGYDPNAVPLAPAWPGAVDGIEAFSKRTNPLRRAQEAAQKVREMGFEPANHGDYVRGWDGCSFRRAWKEGLIPGLSQAITDPKLVEFIKKKVGVDHLLLVDALKDPLGFLLNRKANTTVLPDGGLYYPIDVSFGEAVGIRPERFLPVIAVCGELMLAEDARNLFIV